MIGRRSVLVGLTVLSLASHTFAQTAARTRVVLLGTKGGPTPGPYRAQPATAIVVDGHCYLVDCGNGVAQQMAKAGIALPSLDQVFVTHNHSDHVIDAGTLAVLAWGSGLAHPIGYHGPPPLAQIVREHLAAMNYDIGIRMKEEGRPRSRLWSMSRNDRRRARCSATSASASHRRWSTIMAFKPAFAYRFELQGAAGGRSVVISGDTTYSPALVALAKGADLLIHEAMYAPAIRSLGSENASTLHDHLIHSHSTTQQVGRVAAEAGVKKLVLSHLVPANPAITDEMWLAGVREFYHGEAVVGRDLMEV